MKIKRKISMLIGTVLAASCVGVGAAMIVSAQANYELNEIVYEDTYAYGQTIELPSGIFSNGTERFEADVSLICPDGTVLNGKKGRATLDQYGTYSVQYKTHISNREYVEEFSFSTILSRYFVDGNGTCEYKTMDVSNWPTLDYTYGEVNYDVLRSKPVVGLYTTMIPGDTFYYNKPIDISKATKVDNLISVLVLPDTLNTLEFSYMYITLTDIYDSTNTLGIMLSDNDDLYDYGFRTSCVKGNYGDELYIGLDNAMYSVSTMYGARVNMSFHGLTKNTPIQDSPVCLSFDYASKCLYADGRLVTDYTSPECFSIPWDGFTTGECMVSITLGGYSGAQASFVIQNIYGEDNLDEAILEDVNAPNIIVDYQGYEKDTLPNAVVGKKYALFNAIALDDLFGEVNVSRYVYRNYYSTNKVLVQSDSDGFIPKVAEPHYIVYRACDAFGNTSEIVLPLTIYDDNHKFEASFENEAQTVGTGETIEISLPTVQNASGNVYYDWELKSEEGIVAFGTDVSTYIPLHAGKYTLECTAVDYLDNVSTCSMDYNVTLAQKQMVIDDYQKMLPKLFLSGFSYDMPSFEVWDFEERKYVAAQVSFSVGTYDNNKYTVPYGETKVDITIGGAQAKPLKFSSEIRAINNELGEYDLSSLFYSNDGITAEYVEYAKAMYAKYSYGVGDSKLKFVNKVISSLFDFTFTLKDSISFEKFSVVLTDYEQDSIQVALTFEKKGTELYVTVNHGRSVKVVDLVSLNSGIDITITYDSDSRTFSVGKTRLKVNECLNGDTFEGFESEYVDLEMQISASHNGSFIIKSLCGQQINQNTRDTIRPMIYIKNKVAESQEINTKTFLGTPYVCDIISPVIRSATLSVYSPSKTILSEVVLDNYEILFDEYGTYTLIYTIVDANGQTLLHRPRVEVADLEAPQVSFEGGKTETVEFNTLVNLKTPIVKDNIDGADSLEITIFIQDPYGYSFVVEKASYTFTVEGVYHIYYRVEDTSGNYTLLDYEVRVEK